MPGSTDLAVEKPLSHARVVGYAAELPKYTPVLLDTRLGGAPVLPPLAQASAGHAYCGVCGGNSSLVIQAYAPESEGEHRVVLVFACNSARCSEDPTAWTARRLRFPADIREEGTGHGPEDCGVRRSDDSEGLMDLDKFSRAWQGVSSEDDDDGDMGSMLALLNLRDGQLATRKASGTEENAKGKPTKRGSKKKGRKRTGNRIATTGVEPTARFDTTPGSEVVGRGPWLRSVPIEVAYEPVADRGLADEDPDVSRLLAAYRKSELSGEVEAGCAAEVEEVESPSKLARDSFRECLERAPGHVVRHERNGSVVWPVHPAPKNPVCGCGREMCFEMQLMPACLHFLDCDARVAQDSDVAGMNWATAAVYFCDGKCWSSNEDGKVIVQPDDF